jgi:basic membrane lipoprotein Med (substrate-binding protein (PBP1-ABC) superfamily)
MNTYQSIPPTIVTVQVQKDRHVVFCFVSSPRHLGPGGRAFAGALSPLSSYAADPLRVGILIPGSKSDKGWMESGYDGLVAARRPRGTR